MSVQKMIQDEVIEISAHILAHFVLVVVIELNGAFDDFVVVIVSVDKGGSAYALLRIAYRIMIELSRKEHDSANPWKYHHLIFDIYVEYLFLQS